MCVNGMGSNTRDFLYRCDRMYSGGVQALRSCHRRVCTRDLAGFPPFRSQHSHSGFEFTSRFDVETHSKYSLLLEPINRLQEGCGYMLSLIKQAPRDKSPGSISGRLARKTLISEAQSWRIKSITSVCWTRVHSSKPSRQIKTILNLEQQDIRSSRIGELLRGNPRCESLYSSRSSVGMSWN